MKKTKLHFMLFLSICILISTGDVFAAKTFYDDFSTGHLDGTKWWPREYAREILDGQLVLKLGNSSGMGAEIRQGLFDNQIPFTNPGSINSIECDITIEETVFDSPDSYSVARVAGYFYNKNASGGATGDIFFHIKVGDMGNVDGLEVNWVAYEVQNDDGSSLVSLGEGTLIAAGGINYQTPVNVKLSYDGDKTFSFPAGGQSDSFVGPARMRSSQIASKTLNATILTQNSADRGFIFAKFDNVTVNNQPYDDFSSPRRFTGSQFIFKCNDQTLSYTITTPSYPPFGEHRGLRTRVNLDPGESGYMKAQFDDVYIIKKVYFNLSIPMLLLSGE